MPPLWCHMYKILISLSILMFLFLVSPPKTYASGVVYSSKLYNASAYELGSAAVRLSGRNYLLPTSVTSGLPSLGHASNYGYMRTALLPIAGSIAVVVGLEIGYDALRSAVERDPSSYPTLYALMFGKAYSKLTDDSLPLGAVAKDRHGAPWTITSPSYPFTTVFKCDAPIISNILTFYNDKGDSFTAISPQNQIVYFHHCGGSTVCYQLVQPATQTDINNLPDTAYSPDQVLPSLNSDSARDDIDKAVTNNPDIASPPSNPPSTLEEAQEAADAADDALDDTDDNPDTEEEEIADFSNPAPPDLHNVDLTPLLRLGDKLSDKFPFSLLKTVTAICSSLVASPVAPSFTIDFPSPFNYTWVVSLERWDNYAATFRFLIGASFLVAVSMQITRRWV